MALNIDAELVELERSLIEKVSSTDYAVRINTGSASITALESQVAALRSLVNKLDDERPLIQPLLNKLNCKIAVTAYQIRINTASASLDTLTSDMARIRAQMNTLEIGASALLDC
ncbi:MAG: hypothetical protein ACXABY_21085 [Candidatus Thorarchaeota archaeon]|jgi:hypothetical protein